MLKIATCGPPARSCVSYSDLGATGPSALNPWPRDDQISGSGKTVGVTGSCSFLGVEIVKLLLRKGYRVRAIVQRMSDTEARERAIEQFLTELLHAGNEVTRLELVDFDVMDLDDTVAALQGCDAIFHTVSAVDPNSISGYQEHTVDAEVKGTSNVVAACARAETVSALILTSSAATVVWCEQVLSADTHLTATINSAEQKVHFVNTSRQTCSCSSSGSCCYKLMNLTSAHLLYSDSQLCREKKLWFALAKTEAEKAAWNLAKATGVRMLAVNPALLTGPDFVEKNATPTIAYLKGAKEMQQKGLLAHVSVTHAAHAHVHVFERHISNAVGEAQSRYICFDESFTDAELATLASQLSPLVHLPL